MDNNDLIKCMYFTMRKNDNTTPDLGEVVNLGMRDSYTSNHLKPFVWLCRSPQCHDQIAYLTSSPFIGLVDDIGKYGFLVLIIKSKAALDSNFNSLIKNICHRTTFLFISDIYREVQPCLQSPFVFQ